MWIELSLTEVSKKNISDVQIVTDLPMLILEKVESVFACLLEK